MIRVETWVQIDRPADEVFAFISNFENNPSGFFKLAEPLLARIVQRSVDSDYQNLKRVLEQGG